MDINNFNSIQFNSKSDLLRVEHDKFTENFFSHGPQKKKKKKRDNKVSETKGTSPSSPKLSREKKLSCTEN